MPTRLIELHPFNGNGKRIFAKIEADNPTGSLKDRMVGYVLDQLIEKGEIRPGMTIVEASSGNTGIALSHAALLRGYSSIICVPTSITPKKKKKIREKGGNLLEFDTQSDPEADITAARDLGQKVNHYFFNQFENPYHVLAYYRSLGMETHQQLQQIGVTPEILIAGVGTGGSIRGLGAYLRTKCNPTLRINAVGPISSPTLIEGLHPGHIRAYFPIWNQRPAFFEQQYIRVTDAEALTYMEHITSETGISAGPSSGAVLAAAINHTQEPGIYLLLFADNGDRYTH